MNQGKYHYANITFGTNQVTYAKTYLDINTVQNTLITNYQGSDEKYLEKLLGKSCFPFPKITGFIVDLLKISTQKNDLILDFFAGSGTIGDSVMQLNAEDGGNRKFILVQLDESIKENTEAYKFCTEHHFKPVISSITIERLNRAGDKIKNETQFSDDKKLDIGYKVFSLTKKPTLAQKGKLFVVEHHRATTADKLYNMLSASGKPLHTPIKELKKDVLYLVDFEQEKALYLLGNIDDLKGYEDAQIFIDGWADINLEQWLNLFGMNEKEADKERVVVVY